MPPQITTRAANRPGYFSARCHAPNPPIENPCKISALNVPVKFFGRLFQCGHRQIVHGRQHPPRYFAGIAA